MNNKFIKNTNKKHNCISYTFENNNFIFNTFKLKNNIIFNNEIISTIISSYQRLINSNRYGLSLYYRYKNKYNHE